MSEISTRLVNRIKKDNEILKDRSERYLRDLRVYKEFNDKLVEENLKLENEILNLRKIINIYENRQDRTKN